MGKKRGKLKQKPHPLSCGLIPAVIAVLLCALFPSCKKKAETSLADRTPLSKKIDQLKNNASWAYEIEGERLSQNITSVPSIVSKDIVLDPSALIALEGGFAHKGIFPELAGFASLDTSNIQGGLLDTVNSFCRALTEATKKEPATAKAGTEQESQEEETAAESPSAVQPVAQQEESGLPDEDASPSAVIDSFFTPRTLYSLVLFLADTESAGEFNSFIIGQPFIAAAETDAGQDDKAQQPFIEIPVRFSCKNKTIYAMIYPVMQNEIWKIHQIELYKSEDNKRR